MDRRQRERRPHLEPIRFESPTASGTGRLVNVGCTGAFVGSEELPTAGQYVVLSLLDSTRTPLEIEGLVRWAGARGSDGVRGFGVEVSDPPREYLELVESLPIQATEGCGRRVAPRVSVCLPVAIEFGGLIDDATLCDISLTGARLEGTEIRPRAGDDVILTFALSLDQEPFEVTCRVIRPTPSGGYAVAFGDVDPALTRAVEEAAESLRSYRDGYGRG